MYSPQFMAPRLKSNQSELWQWILGISDFQLPIANSFLYRLCCHPFNAKQLAIGIWQSEMLLSLGELEALAGALLPVLLAFFDAWVTRDQTCLLERRTKVRVVFKQRPRNPMSNSAGLSGRSAAANVDQDIKLSPCFGQLQRLPNNHAQRFIGKILVKRLAVNLKVAATGS
jgi:hypothetical protein